ncbi:GNAT family N-acetyltransferase [Aliiroseovarius sp. PTFE2010]|uniref:GNAT family N-acetyltransferase n=1 Tax=Aliiroseovarius sp. PTFE2010 TaxID=3417190 RepID=UPI003CEF7B0A
MEQLVVRRAGPIDAAAMFRLVNEIRAAFGTEAIVDPLPAEEIQRQIRLDRSVWHQAEDGRGDVLGIQWIIPHSELGPRVASIATVTKVGRTGLRVGSALFERTERAARDLGYAWINAEIRADNRSGLIYYQSRGFEDWGKKVQVSLDDGSVVDKIFKRYELR